MKLSDLSDRDLLRGLAGLVSTERQCVARLVAYLAEVEERRLHLADACSSLFDFCQRRLGLSESEAFRRMTAARLVRRFPSILTRLEQGEIHLSALALLAKHLTDENHDALLHAASHKSKREVQELLATRFPKDDVPTTFRLLSPTNGEARPSRPRTIPEPSLTMPPRAPAPPTKPSVEQLSPSRYKVQFTASQELRDKLERASRLMSHRNVCGDLTIVLDEALDLLIANLEKQRLGKTTRPRRAKTAKTGHVTRAALREVFERDGEQCTFVNEAGERCPATEFLEIDHVEPRAQGGAGSSENLRVLCRAHNQFVAEKAFGREHVERKIRLRRNKSRAKALPTESAGSVGPSRPDSIMPSASRSEPTSTNGTSGQRSLFELAVRALSSMGFREPEARRAVVEVHDQAGANSASMAIEAILRHALAILSSNPTPPFRQRK